MNDLNTILEDVKQEGDTNPFKDLNEEKETPSESPTEKKEPEENAEKEEPKEGEKDNTPKEEEDVPFHKHPRWIERESELKELREREETTIRELSELKSFKQEVSQRLDTSNKDVPDWFQELYGDNEVAYRKYEEHEKVRTSEIERNILEKQEISRRQLDEEGKRWNKWVDDEIGKLHNEGKQFDRNELIKTMLEYKPTDENNNFDFKAGYKIYEAMKTKEIDPAKSQARKEIADTTMKNTSGEKKVKDFLTQADLRNKSWNQL